VTKKKVVGLSYAVEEHLQKYFEIHCGCLPPSGLYKRVLTEMERPLFKLVMKHVDNNQLKAADVLGINRNTLRKKLQDHKIKVK
jgi:two-component system nitrogen regulation response regulator GlnG